MGIPFYGANLTEHLSRRPEDSPLHRLHPVPTYPSAHRSHCNRKLFRLCLSKVFRVCFWHLFLWYKTLPHYSSLKELLHSFVVPMFYDPRSKVKPTDRGFHSNLLLWQQSALYVRMVKTGSYLFCSPGYFSFCLCRYLWQHLCSQWTFRLRPSSSNSSKKRRETLMVVSGKTFIHNDPSPRQKYPECQHGLLLWVHTHVGSGHHHGKLGGIHSQTEKGKDWPQSMAGLLSCFLAWRSELYYEKWWVERKFSWFLDFHHLINLLIIPGSNLLRQQ